MRVLIAGTLLIALANAETPYQATIEQFRRQREANLKSDTGWLTVAGLFWLHDGANAAGSDPKNAIVLPRGPAKYGVFELRNGKTTFHPVSGAPVDLKADTDGPPTQLRVDTLTLFVIHRGQRYGIRMRDTASKLRAEFTGEHWLPVNETYRVTAKFVPYPAGKTITVPNILGEVEQEPCPGYVEFTLSGQTLRLDPVVEGDELFFIFHDQTSGKETYPPGRFLYSAMPANGKVELDFNKAINPPCAFTPFATCPLPPKQNRLPIRIEAGELNYGHH